MMFSRDLSFDDVLIDPKFSFIESRKDVELKSPFLELNLRLPVISSNMDTITGSLMASTMEQQGAIGCLHRFMTIEENIEAFGEARSFNTMVSIGLGEKEYERALRLVDVGATNLVIDVAHGASIGVVRQYDLLRERFKDNVSITVGNFANGESVEAFIHHSAAAQKMDAIKVGIGGGSMCTTRLITGCGRSTLSSIFSCGNLGIPIIADGGFRSPGDIFKALAAGAEAVMLGGMLSGTDETPGETQYWLENIGPERPGGIERLVKHPTSKTYRGSASKDSYDVQGKNASFRSPEGEATAVPCKGPVANVLQWIEGGIRSGMSYVGAKDYSSIRENSTFIEISNSTILESKAHGKK